MSTRPISTPTSTPTSCGTADAPPAAPPPPPKAPAAGANPVARASLEDGLDLEIGLAKGPASKNVDIELFTASARVKPGQVTLQAGLSRIDVHSEDRGKSISTEKLTAKVNVSKDNPDGSVGGNASFGATLIGVEGTWTRGGNSVTGGLSAGVGAEVGVGTRDFDKDGRPEFCARVSFLVATVGTCLENPF